jgi:hypothetical protein
MGAPQKGRADYLALGDYNVACSMCGRKRKASEVVRNWQGLYRCPEHNEPRQPQDFARGVKEVISPPWAQIETDQFVAICGLNGISAIPWYAMPGCSLPGRPNIDPTLPDPVYMTTEGGDYITLNEGLPWLTGNRSTY